MHVEQGEIAEDLYSELTAAGYIPAVAEALSENGIGLKMALLMSRSEILDMYLSWNGIHGYTQTILEVADNPRPLVA
jgi:hypothetical protein